MEKYFYKKGCVCLVFILLASVFYLPTAGALNNYEQITIDQEPIKSLTPDLIYYPTYHDFGYVLEGELHETIFDIWNGGTDNLTWSLGIVDPWINLNPTSGSSTGEHNAITVRIDTTGLSIGSYVGLISISANDGGGTRYFTVYFEVVSNIAPNTPGKPNGPISVTEGVQYTYTTSTTDPNGDDVKYGFDFDNDGIINPDHWTSFLTSGAPCTVYITFYGTGTRYLRVKAEDIYGLQSNFSDALVITVSGSNNPPNTPSKPTGPSSGYPGVSYTFSTTTTDPNDDTVKYGWDWNGDGTVDEWSNLLPSGSTDSRIHTWTTEGTYYVKVVAEDSKGGQSAFSLPIAVYISSNNPPNKPTITGPSSGRIGISITFAGIGIDPDGDQIYYLFDWGDNTNSGWKGPYNSGQTAQESHSWSSLGSFSVKVKTKDMDGIESVWSDPLSVSMPKNKSFSMQIYTYLENYQVINKLLQRI
jgi:hypothetical protein